MADISKIKVNGSDYTVKDLIARSVIDDTKETTTNTWSASKVKTEIDSKTFTLPTASTTTLGGVKVDGSTVTINSNGVISSSGGSMSAEKISYAEYQALTYAQKHDGTVRYVPDYPGGNGTLTYMSYAQYQALTDTQKNDGTARFVYDYPIQTSYIDDESTTSTSKGWSANQSYTELTKINNKLSVQSGQIQAQSGVVFDEENTDTKVYKYGKVVTFCFRIINATSTGTVATLPVGFRPKKTLFYPLMSDTGYEGKFNIQNNGNIYSSGCNMYGCYYGTFIVD